MLGLTELLLVEPFVAFPSALGVALVWSGAVMVVACCAALRLAMRVAGVPGSHADLVGGMLGPLSVAAVVAPLLARTEWAWAGWATAVGGAPLLLGASLAGALLARRLERSRPPSAALAWLGASLSMASVAWYLHGGDRGAAWLPAASLALGIAFGALGFAGRVPGGRGAPANRFGGLLLVVALAAIVLPGWSAWLPWLLYEQKLPEVGAWPPNFLLVALGTPRLPGAAAGSLIPSVELLRAEAVEYPALSPEPEVESLLKLPDGSLLGLHLQGAGYATAAIGGASGDRRELGMAEVDDRPGGARLLRESGAWMAGGPLLLGPASGLLGWLGHGSPVRSPEQIGAEASRWILDWRTTRARAPFLLFVDLRIPGASVSSLESGLDRIRRRLEELQLDRVTILIVATQSAEPSTEEASLEVLLVPPFAWQRAPGSSVPARVWGRSLGRALLAIAQGDGKAPVRLPGLDEEIALPDLR